MTSATTFPFSPQGRQPWRLGAAWLMAGLLSLCAAAHAAMPAAGTVLRVQARASYAPQGWSQTESVLSNVAEARVQAVDALQLSGDAWVARPPGVHATVPYRVLNTGNTVLSLVQAVANAGSCSNGSDSTDLLNLRVVWDVNSNGVADPAELASSAAPRLRPGESASLLVLGDVPMSNVGGACLQLSVGSSAQPQMRTLSTFVSIADNPVVQLGKTVRYAQALRPGSADSAHYTLTASNIGTRIASQTAQSASGEAITVNGVAQRFLLLRDVLPAGSLYRVGSLQASHAGARKLYRVANDPAFAYREGEDQAAVEIAVAYPFDLAVGQTINAQFDLATQASVGRELLNVAQLHFGNVAGAGAGVGGVAAVQSNDAVAPVAGQRLGLAHWVVGSKINYTAANAPDGTVTYTLALRVRNYGDAPLYNLRLPHLLAALGLGSYTTAELPAAGQYTVVAGSLQVVDRISSDTVLTPNDAFTGQGGQTLLAKDGAVLPVGGDVTLRYAVRVNVSGRANTSLPSQITGQGSLHAYDSLSVDASDVSTNGSDPDPDQDFNPNNNSVPTPIVFPDVAALDRLAKGLVISKTAADPVRVSQGVYQLTYTVRVSNTSDVSAPYVRVVDNLACAFDPSDAALNIASWKLVKPPVARYGVMPVSPAYTGEALCDDAQASANAEGLYLPHDPRIILNDSSKTLAPGATEEYSFTVQITQRTLGLRSQITNKAWLAAMQDNALVNAGVQFVATSALTSLLVDPQGYVYDSVSRLPVPGALVTLRRTACDGGGTPPPIVAAEVFDAEKFSFNSDGSVSLRTGADGQYQFFWRVPPVSDICTYALSVTPPASHKLSTQIQGRASTYAGCGFVVPDNGIPTGSAPTTWFPQFRSGYKAGASPASCEALHNNIPLDPATLNSALLLNKKASKSQVELGDFVDYQLTLSNQSGATLSQLQIADALPSGFRYVPGSAWVGGTRVAEPVRAGADAPTASTTASPALLFRLGELTLADKGELTLRYRLAVGVGAVSESDAVNSARASAVSAAAALMLQSNLAQAKVRVSGGVLGNQAFAIGKVYADCNRNKTQDGADEPGIPGVRLYLEDGSSVITDQQGRWSLYGLKPITHVLRVDRSTLPVGAQLALLDNRQSGQSDSRFLDLKNGGLMRADFALDGCEVPGLLAEIEQRRAAFAKSVDQQLQALVNARLPTESRVAITGDVRSLPASGSIEGSGAAIGSAQAQVDAQPVPLIALPSGLSGLGAGASGTPVVPAPAKPALPQPASSAPSAAPAAAPATSAAPSDAPSDATEAAAASADPAASAPAAVASPAAATPVLPPPPALPVVPASPVQEQAWAQQRAVDRLLGPLLPRPAVDPAPLEALIESLEPRAAFLGLQDGDALDSDQIRVRITGPQQSTLRLYVNEALVPDTRVGKKAVVTTTGLVAYEYIGVELKAGLNTLRMEALDEFGNVRQTQSVTVRAVGALARLQLITPERLAADPLRPARLRLRLSDAQGLPVIARTAVTLEAQGARWVNEDLNAGEPGVQIFVEGGEAELLLQPPAQQGVVGVRITAGPVALNQSLSFLPALTPLQGIGIVEGVLDFSRGGRLALSQPQAANAFEQQLSGLAHGDDAATRASARAAFYVKGAIRGDTLLTAAYDSDKSSKERLFRDIRPDEFYPVYGDGSVRGFDAQSSGKLYVRIDKNRSFLLLGDFVSASSAEVRQLSQYSRALTGLQHRYQDENLRVTSFFAQTNAVQQVEELPATGLSFYTLSNVAGDIKAGSEKVEILTRDRFQPQIVLAARALTRGSDYSFEPLTRRLYLVQPVASVDADLNPQSIRVSYELDAGGPRYKVMGTDVQVKVGERVQLGAVAVRDDNPQNARTLTAATALVRAGEHTVVSAEAVQTHTDQKGRGQAARLTVQHDSGALKAQAQLVKTGANFDNLSATAGAGRTELTASADYALSEATTLRAQAQLSRTETGTANTGTTGTPTSGGDTRSNLALSVLHKLGPHTVVEAGVRSGNSSGTVTTASDAGVGTGAGTGVGSGAGSVGLAGGATASTTAQTPDNSTTVRARITHRPEAVAGLQVFAEAEQDVQDGHRHALVLGGSYALTAKTRLYAQHAPVSTLADLASTTGQNLRGATLIGIDSAYMEGGRLYNEYRAASSGAPVLAAGVRNTYAINEQWRVNGALERVQTVGGGGNTAATTTGASAGSSTPSSNTATAVALGADYAAGPWRMSGAVERRHAASGDSGLYSLAGAWRLGDDLTLLGRAILTETDASGASRRIQRQQLGLAWRPALADRWNILASYEHRTESASGGSDSATGGALGGASGSTLVGNGRQQTHILSAHANWQMAPGQQLALRWAGKLSRLDDSLANGSTWAQLVHARYTRDLTADWDLGVQGGLMWGRGAARQSTLGLELGYQAMPGLWVSAGYNVLGLRDPDLTGQNITSRGVYLRLRWKFDESVLRFGRVAATPESSATPVGASPAMAPVTGATAASGEQP